MTSGRPVDQLMGLHLFSRRELLIVHFFVFWQRTPRLPRVLSHLRHLFNLRVSLRLPQEENSTDLQGFAAAGALCMFD